MTSSCGPTAFKDCPEHHRLYRIWRDAVERRIAIVSQLTNSLRLTDQEYEYLHRQTMEARLESEQTLQALEEHERMHGC